MQLQPYVDYPKLVNVFRETGEWMALMGVRDVGTLNEAIAGERVREVVLVAEALHEQRIAHVADEIARRRRHMPGAAEGNGAQGRLVLIAGHRLPEDNLCEAIEHPAFGPRAASLRARIG
jgi:hypothetical protein